jgi:flagellar hook-length control protein FliK
VGPKGAATGVSQAQAKAALEMVVPGVKVQTKTVQTADQTSAAAPAPSKAALSELLNLPRPAIDTPSLPSLGQTKETSAPDGTASQALAAQNLVQTPVQNPVPVASPATTGAETAALAAAVPGTTAPGKAATPAALSEPPAQANNPSLASQVEGSIKWLLKNQDQGAELQLHPESLGRVQISLKVEGTQVHARVWASDPAALPVLQDHRASLEASLKEQGLSLGSFNLQQGRQNEQTPAPTPALPASTPFQITAEAGQETPTAPAPSLSEAHHFEVVA